MSSQHSNCDQYGHHTLSGVWRNVMGDIHRQLTMNTENIALGDSRKRKLSAFLRPEIQSLFLYRISHFFYTNGWKRLGWCFSRFNFMLHKVNISPQSCIGPGFRLPHPPGVIFHGQAGPGLTLFSLAICCADENCLDGDISSGPNLGDSVILGAHAVLMGPITVGSDVRISYAVRLAQDVPAGKYVISKIVHLKYRDGKNVHGAD